MSIDEGRAPPAERLACPSCLRHRQSAAPNLSDEALWRRWPTINLTMPARLGRGRCRQLRQGRTGRHCGLRDVPGICVYLLAMPSVPPHRSGTRRRALIALVGFRVVAQGARLHPQRAHRSAHPLRVNARRQRSIRVRCCPLPGDRRRAGTLRAGAAQLTETPNSGDGAAADPVCTELSRRPAKGGRGVVSASSARTSPRGMSLYANLSRWPKWTRRCCGSPSALLRRWHLRPRRGLRRTTSPRDASPGRTRHPTCGCAIAGRRSFGARSGWSWSGSNRSARSARSPRTRQHQAVSARSLPPVSQHRHQWRVSEAVQVAIGAVDRAGSQYKPLL